MRGGGLEVPGLAGERKAQVGVRRLVGAIEPYRQPEARLGWKRAGIRPDCAAVWRVGSTSLQPALQGPAAACTTPLQPALQVGARLRLAVTAERGERVGLVEGRRLVRRLERERCAEGGGGLLTPPCLVRRVAAVEV